MVDDKKVERLYTVPFGKAYEYTRTKRAKRAVQLLRAFLLRHMKTAPWNIKISAGLNEHIWADSMQHPPRKVKIAVVKEGEIVKASLPDEKPKKSKKPKKTAKKAETKTAEPEKVEKPKEEKKADEKKTETKKEEKK